MIPSMFTRPYLCTECSSDSGEFFTTRSSPLCPGHPAFDLHQQIYSEAFGTLSIIKYSKFQEFHYGFADVSAPTEPVCALPKRPFHSNLIASSLELLDRAAYRSNKVVVQLSVSTVWRLVVNVAPGSAGVTGG